MANFATNPWSLTSTDVASAVPVASPNGLVLNADGTVTVTTGGAFTFNVAGVPPARWFTVINATNAAYNGEYDLIQGVSGGTVFVMVPQFSIPAGTAGSGGGTIAQCLWPWMVRVEDISWQNAPANGVLDIRDRSGLPEWLATNNTATVGTQNRGKLFWVNGITPILLPASSILIITID